MLQAGETSREEPIDETNRLVLNEPDVVAKVLDGEAIIINLKTGVYCSLNPTGTFIWQCLLEGASLAETSEALAECYVPTPETAATDTHSLAVGLMNEGLIRVDPSATAPAPDWTTPKPGGSSYEIPRLDVFSDMAELLALDPPMPGLPGAWDDPAENES